MAKWHDYIVNNLHVAISLPAILCFVQFVACLFGAVRTGVFNGSTVTQLLSYADGFESVILFFIMLISKAKKG